MSMNGFFKAFTDEQIQAMLKDYSLIDEWVWDDDESAFSTDVESAWDVLDHLLNGVGFLFTKEVENALSNGCFFIYPNHAKSQFDELSKWSRERVLEEVNKLTGEEDLYHISVYCDDEGQEYLLEQFDKLVEFYEFAASHNLGAVYYLA